MSSSKLSNKTVINLKFPNSNNTFKCIPCGEYDTVYNRVTMYRNCNYDFSNIIAFCKAGYGTDKWYLFATSQHNVNLIKPSFGEVRYFGEKFKKYKKKINIQKCNIYYL